MLELAEIDRHGAKEHLSQAMAEMKIARDIVSGEDIPPGVADSDRLMARLRREMDRVGKVAPL